MASPDMIKQMLPQLMPALVNYLKSVMPGMDFEYRGEYVVVKIPWDVVVARIREEFIKNGVDPVIELFEDHMEVMLPVASLINMAYVSTTQRPQITLKKVM